ncbi:MAG: hypothetical protein OEL55_03315 [Desulfobulbaceae bacterium]|nr:hypothetical protein [Desulfobulbaceae bacterium]
MMKSFAAWSQYGTQNKTARCTTSFLILFFLFNCIIIPAFLAESAQAADATMPATMILPFKINAPKTDATKLAVKADNALQKLANDKKFSTIERSKAMSTLAYTTSWPPSSADLKKISSTQKAEYVIVGTLNQIGNHYSIDMTVFDLLEENPPKYLFKEGDASKGILPLLNDLADEALAYTERDFCYAEITVSGNKRIDSGAILRKIESKKGDHYDANLLDKDIRNVFKMGYFNDVQVNREDTDAGIKINFTVTEKEVVGLIKIKGEDKINKKDIKEVITIAANSIINPKELRSSIDSIKKLYKDKGFYRTEVTSELNKSKDDRVDITFVINEGFKAYIKEIIISGNNDFSDKEIKKVMMTSERGLFSWFTDAGILKRDMIDQDAARINAFYNNNGYIDVKVGKP